jgi:protein involved in sex pheromone biosynthesis
MQVPFILAFLATENWERIGQAMRSLSLQGLTIGLALGSVAFFKL